ncbi:MAG: hypothetical protein PHQ23_11005 [Candidatus Wallbacteria bacterium]|nr:hypothetical protein [Candidatus Wallbacteria bacterium]
MKWIEKPETRKPESPRPADGYASCWIDTCNCRGCDTNDCCNKGG